MLKGITKMLLTEMGQLKLSSQQQQQLNSSTYYLRKSVCSACRVGCALLRKSPAPCLGSRSPFLLTWDYPGAKKVLLS